MKFKNPFDYEFKFKYDIKKTTIPMCLVVHLMVATSKYFSVNQSALMVCFQLQFSAAGNATVSTYTREQNV